MNTNSRQEPTPDECADNPDQEITYKSEPRSSDNLTGQPTRYNTDYENDQEIFT